MSINESDIVQNERISKLEERMLMMEQTIIELRGMTKVLKIVMPVGSSHGRLRMELRQQQLMHIPFQRFVFN